MQGATPKETKRARGHTESYDYLVFFICVTFCHLLLIFLNMYIIQIGDLPLGASFPQFEHPYSVIYSITIIIIYIKILLDCDWLISVQLIPNSSAISCNHSAIFCNHSAIFCNHSAIFCNHSAKICNNLIGGKTM